MMHPDVIADITQVALDEHRAAWDIMEQAAGKFMKRRKSRRTLRNSPFVLAVARA
jgi:hypothetical protein